MQNETIANIATVVILGTLLGYLIAFTFYFKNELKKDTEYLERRQQKE
jgi:uncharacterized membrane protein YciS (DUF1049 family)